MPFLIVLLCLLGTLAAQEPAALADYRAGRYQAAYTAFARELGSAGTTATPELRFDTALAALRLQRAGDAAAAVEPLLTASDPAVRAEAEFVTAMSQYQRGELAAAAAQLPDAEPLAWTLALRAMQQAIDGFLRADAARAGWPAAVRNAERAARRRQEFERLRGQQEDAKAKQERAPEPQPQPERPAGEPEAEPDAPASVLDRLSPAELAALLERGHKRDRQKRRERQAVPAGGARVGERDW
jgi:hypothetical protein